MRKWAVVLMSILPREVAAEEHLIVDPMIPALTDITQLSFSPFSYGDQLAALMAQSGHTALPLLRLPSGHLATEMRIDGQRGLFLIDSGASQTVLDATRTALYPLGPVVGRENVTGMVGAQEVTGHRMRHYQIGRATGEGVLIYVADLGFVTHAIAEAGGPVVDGVIGQDLLTRHGALLGMENDRLFLRISGR